MTVLYDNSQLCQVGIHSWQPSPWVSLEVRQVLAMPRRIAQTRNAYPQTDLTGKRPCNTLEKERILNGEDHAPYHMTAQHQGARNMFKYAIHSYNLTVEVRQHDGSEVLLPCHAVGCREWTIGPTVSSKNPRCFRKQATDQVVTGISTTIGIALSRCIPQ